MYLRIVSVRIIVPPTQSMLMTVKKLLTGNEIFDYFKIASTGGKAVSSA